MGKITSSVTILPVAKETVFFCHKYRTLMTIIKILLFLTRFFTERIINYNVFIVHLIQLRKHAYSNI